MSTALVPSTPNVYSLLPARLIAAPTSVQFAAIDQSIAAMVAARAITTPNAPAVVCGVEVLTYADLDRRANRLANHLIGLGVKAETIVALCLDRSAESVICTLAIMKAGGAFLPLDSNYPTERLKFMLNDAQPRVLITKSELADQFGGLCEIISIDRDDTDNCSSETPIVEIHKKQLAYVI